jgi:DNA (cytosine-5)-methyltransferase 1
MRYLSLFSGIEAATAAWHPLGWEPVAFAEIEPFPDAVLAYRYPLIDNLGDVTKITDEDVKALGPIDIVVGGSPCQDLSVAGKRAGLAGARSGLFHEQLRIFHAARTFCGARWLLWENVPGAFSSHKGQDFAIVVGEMAGLNDVAVPKNGWGTEGAAVGDHGLVEWATLDAQWFGVAQRRRRVFALLDTGDWANRPPILLEPESLRGDSAPPRKEIQTGGSWWDGKSVSQTLDAVLYKGQMMPEKNRFPVAMVGSGLSSQEIAKKETVTNSSARFAELIMPSVRVLDQLKMMNLSMKKPQTGSLSHADYLRKITPVEAERLQGFPDGYTQIPWRNKPAEQCPDGPRYKALGNSMAVPVMNWIGKKIQEVL